MHTCRDIGGQSADKLTGEVMSYIGRCSHYKRTGAGDLFERERVLGRGFRA